MNSDVGAKDAGHLQRTVIDGGYCVGCGACAALPGSPMTIGLDARGRMQARSTEAPAAGVPLPVATVCPFSDASDNEDVIGRDLYAQHARHDPRIGFYEACFAGHVAEGEYRAQGSSGGMGNWILAELLRTGLVDGVAHVQPQDPSEADPRLFTFALARDVETLQRGAKSQYYPVEMSQVLGQIRAAGGRWAIVGVPCFVRAVRLLCRADAELRDRIAFTVALVCGHMKSTGFAEMFGWQLGVRPADLKQIDFRHALPDQPANRYGVKVVGHADTVDTERIGIVPEMYGTDWGLGFFKYRACDYCDDVAGELADLTVGDAWLPEYVADWRGTNIAIVRHPELHRLLREAAEAGRLVLDAVSPSAFADSQKANYRHRHSGLAYRLWRDDEAGTWHPPKRIAPQYKHLSKQNRRRFELRSELAEASHAAFAEAKAAGDFGVFRERLAAKVSAYYQIRRPAWWILLARVKNSVQVALRRLRGKRSKP